MKSEPDVFSWDDLVAKGALPEPWTGVRNYQARNYMRQMRLGDLALFYHSNIGKAVVGVMEVVATAHPDPTDTSGTWDCVDVRAVVGMPSPVALEPIKQARALRNMVLVTNSRLSVQPLRLPEFREVCRMGGLDLKAIDAARAAAGVTAGGGGETS
ncbi:MAG: EVE domain-containing protein [Hyphomicrobiaceae bacterium]|nr:EVE domain-containing protein [Hyphomicrobiaceae bacterium]